MICGVGGCQLSDYDFSGLSNEILKAMLEIADEQNDTKFADVIRGELKKRLEKALCYELGIQQQEETK